LALLQTPVYTTQSDAPIAKHNTPGKKIKKKKQQRKFFKK